MGVNEKLWSAPGTQFIFKQVFIDPCWAISTTKEIGHIKTVE